MRKMFEILNITKEMFEKFQGTGLHILLYIVSLLILVIWGRKKNRKISLFLIIYSVLLLIIFFCPVTAKIIMDFCIGRDVYWRMLWLLPYIVTIGYTATSIIFELASKSKKAVAFICVTLLIMLTGTNVYSLMSIEQSAGVSKIPYDVMLVCEKLLHTAEEYRIEQIRVAIPDEFTPYVRQYDASIQMPYGRNVPKDSSHPLHDILYADILDFDALQQAFIQYDCNFLIIDSDEYRDEQLDAHGFYLASSIGVYDIFIYE